MMRFLKLTQYYQINGKPGDLLYVRATEIATITACIDRAFKAEESDRPFTLLRMTGNYLITVCETPEEIISQIEGTTSDDIPF